MSDKKFLALSSTDQIFSSSPAVSINLTPPRCNNLLGSPNTCSIWEPQLNQWPSFPRSWDSAFSISPPERHQFPLTDINMSKKGSELDDIFTVMKEIHNRLDALLFSARNLRMEVLVIRRALQGLRSNVEIKLRHSRELRLDLADKNYLEKIISILNGDLQLVMAENWPFRLFPDLREGKDLII